MTKDEALRLALETLEAIHTQGDVACVVTPNGEIYIKPVITAVKAALEAKDEPVVWNEGVPAMLPKQKEGETFIVSYEPKLEAKDEPWSPVSIGVDVTKEGAHVVGIYALDKDTSQIFYAKHHPAPQRTWVGLTDADIEQEFGFIDELLRDCVQRTEAKLKEKNT